MKAVPVDYRSTVTDADRKLSTSASLDVSQERRRSFVLLLKSLKN
jgi:hypothetical protein